MTSSALNWEHFVPTAREQNRKTRELPWPAPELKPGSGLTEPRLWVRRLRLWHDFADDEPSHGRDINFRRGLNVVWSPPDPQADQGATGHAAGKTLLCRQIRYCLGEDTFADPDDMSAIRERFPQGGVGAEVRLCGVTWVVRRAFSQADDRATRGEDMEALREDVHRDSFGEFREAIEGLVFSDEQRAMLQQNEHVDVPWHFILAWLTRDQECRLDGLTHWRHPESSSHSPVRKAAIATRVNVLRMALGLYSEQSNTARARAIDASLAARDAESKLRQSDERCSVLRKDLATALHRTEEQIWPPPPPSWNDALYDEQRASEAHIRTLEALIDERVRATTSRKISAAQKTDEVALERAKADLAETEQRVASTDELVRLARNHLELLTNANDDRWTDLRRARYPTCPYDDAPLDVEKASFICPLPRLPDPIAARQLAEEAEAQRKTTAAEFVTQSNALAELKATRASLTVRVKNLERTIEGHQLAMTRATHESQAAWAAKSTLRNFVEAIRKLEEARAAAEETRDREKVALERKNEHLSTYSTSHLTKWFDFWVKQVVAKDANGEVVLDGNGLQASIQWRGRRRSVALNSLRIVLFDLAAMLAAAEGHSSAPAFLIHDSPREGDLDPGTYALLFQTALALGLDEESAPFQYVLTTTTEPPEGKVRARIRDQLGAREGTSRYFRVDL